MFIGWTPTSQTLALPNLGYDMRLVENHMEKYHKVLHVTDLKAVPQVDSAYRLLASQLKAWGYKLTQIPSTSHIVPPLSRKRLCKAPQR